MFGKKVISNNFKNFKRTLTINKYKICYLNKNCKLSVYNRFSLVKHNIKFYTKTNICTFSGQYKRIINKYSVSRHFLAKSLTFNKWVLCQKESW